MRTFCAAIAVWIWAGIGFAAAAGNPAPPPVPRVGVLLSGFESSREADDQLRAGVQRALAEWRKAHPGRRLPAETVEIRPSERWDGQTSEIVRSIFDNRLAVVIGAVDRRTAHLAGQVVTRLKGAALLVAISEDESLTRIGVPWLLRAWELSGPKDRADGVARETIERSTRDATYAVLEAVAACGGDAPRIRQFLSANRFPASQGTFTFNESGERVE